MELVTYQRVLDGTEALTEVSVLAKGGTVTLVAVATGAEVDQARSGQDTTRGFGTGEIGQCQDRGPEVRRENQSHIAACAAAPHLFQDRRPIYLL